MNPNSTSQYKNIWYSASRKKFKGKEPFFFETNAPWINLLESKWLVIKNELNDLLKEQTDCLTPYFDTSMVSKPGQWKVFPFFFWNRRFKENCQKCPQTTELLESIPNMVSGSFTLLEPNSTIKPHAGDTNAVVRCHLGLTIPASLPSCGLKVGTEKRSWTEGKILMFCDAHTHLAWNNTEEKRFILLIDVMRTEYVSQTEQICDQVFSSLFRKRIKMLFSK
jgi:ornithine lipid ester-linked acyl 2-hydroxylase